MPDYLARGTTESLLDKWLVCYAEMKRLLSGLEDRVLIQVNIHVTPGKENAVHA
jgi:hypothetical protein